MKFHFPDILSAAQALYVIVKNGGKMTRFVFLPSPMYEVEQALRQYGVLVYGRSVRLDGSRTFLVKNAQARWAHQICFRHNFPVVSPYFSENEKYRGVGPPKKSWQKDGRKGDAFYALAELFKKIISWLS